MSNYDQKTMQEALDALAQFGSIRAAAEALGIARSTLSTRANAARAEGLSPRVSIAKNGPLLEHPELSSSKLTDDELLDKLSSRYLEREREATEHRWYKVRAKSNAPMAICWFGDPHLDDNGCNIPLLRRHVEIVANTPGMVGANIGDTTNNWVGRLAQIYEEQEVTRSAAMQLIRWFLLRSEIEWLLVLLGNHDEWRGGAEIIRAMTQNLVPVQDWHAQIKLTFPNGRELPIWAAHDFKGSSQWNPLHGPMKVAGFSGEASLYICGHRHNWALFHTEDPHRSKSYWACRARGYKALDKYAEKLFFGHQEHGASIVSVIDPTANDALGFLHCFADVEAAADYLTWRRGKAGVTDGE